MTDGDWEEYDRTEAKRWKLYGWAMGCFLLAMIMFTAAGESRGVGIGGVCGVLAFPAAIAGVVLGVRSIRT